MAQACNNQNQTDPSSKELTQVSTIVNFYKGKNVLITGASGFLGKVLLWKLVETCKGIGKIYVLIRSKNNASADKRLLQMLKEEPFASRHNLDELLETVVAVESDVTAPGLGLSERDRVMLHDKVNIVIHCAASVKFDAPLKDNMRDNVYGTRSIVELCNEVKNLNALVHVSTAYSNCQAKDIGEDIQPLEKDIDEVIRTVETLDDVTCERISDKLLEGRPNTYTYTKAIAEHYVARQEGKYPISIVRPSIVIPATNEPYPGWVDNVNGMAGLGALAAIGVLRTIDWDYHATSDMVPVDSVANCLICAAYEVSERSPKKMLIYNMTSGNICPISWGRWFELLRDKAVKRPSNKIVRPMIHSPKYNRANPLTFTLTRYLSELLFAYTVDFIITLLGYKKILVKITKKMHHGYKILMPFTTNQWNFNSDNVVSLYESLSKVDQNLFKFDLRGFNWEQQAEATWAGARLYLLKEEATEDSYKSGLQRQTLVTLVHYGCMAVVMVLLTLFAYSTTNTMRTVHELVV